MIIDKEKIRYQYIYNHETINPYPIKNNDYEKILKVFNLYVHDFDRIEELFWTSIKTFLDEIESE